MALARLLERTAFIRPIQTLLNTRGVATTRTIYDDRPWDASTKAEGLIAYWQRLLATTGTSSQGSHHPAHCDLDLLS